VTDLSAKKGVRRALTNSGDIRGGIVRAPGQCAPSALLTIISLTGGKYSHPVGNRHFAPGKPVVQYSNTMNAEKDTSSARANYRISLAALMMFCAAAPLWIYLTLIVASSPGFGPFGYVAVPLILIAATVAIARLTARSAFGVALAALIAVVVLYGSLLLVALWAASQ
jgi:hypothetical protein